MKKIILCMLIAALSLSAVPVWAAAAEEESAEPAVYTQDFTDLASVREDFTAYSVYDMGMESDSDSIDEDIAGTGRWYLDTIDGQPAVTRKDREGSEPLTSSDGTRNISVLTFTKRKFVNFELEVEFRRGTSTIYWAGVGIRQLIPGKYFLEDGAGIFCQQEGQTTLWGTDGVGGPYQTNAKPGFKPNDFHKLKVVCNGLKLEISVDDEVTMTRDLPRSFFRNGYISLISVNNDSSYRNFKVTELPVERLPEEEAQSPKKEADSLDSLTNLSKLPPAERVSLPGKSGVDVWTITAIVSIVLFLAVAAFGLVLVLSRKKAAVPAADATMRPYSGTGGNPDSAQPQEPDSSDGPGNTEE